MGIVEQYLSQLKNMKRRWRYTAAILVVLSLIVAIGVAWNLRMTGLTIANGATCGQEEHQHTAECLMETVLVCGYAEETAAEDPAESPANEPVHIHDDACYASTWSCGLETHIHAFSCYADSTADLETSDSWEASLPSLTDEWADDLVLIAQSQLGCGESARNYIIADDGETKNGITRYGQWYGNPYGDWSSMFIMFCLNYANIPPDAVPPSPGVYNMMRLAQDAEIFLPPDADLGNSGNLLFLDTDGNGVADRSVIVVSSTEEGITAIGGDLDNTVKEITLSADDRSVLGYINIRALQQTHTDVPTSKDNPEQPAAEAAPEDAAAAPALMMSTGTRAQTDSVGSYLNPMGDNLWQIVEGGYEGREETNKLDYGNVHIQKNVVPTDTENEFLVYLSISKKLSMKAIFDYGSYYASSANGSVGEITSTSQGNPQPLSLTQTGTYKTPFYMIIQVWNDSQTQMKFETDILVRYTNKGMKNGKILLEIPGTNQAIVVANVKNYAGTSADNPVRVTLTESQLTGSGGNYFEEYAMVDTVLDTVVDEMGPHIELVEVVAGDYERTPTYSGGKLTWLPISAAPEMRASAEQTWQNNAAQLVYKIRLKNDQSCAKCLDTVCSTSHCDHVYPTNKSAVLTYHLSDAPSTSYTAEFNIPYVRGLLYDIHFIKIDQDTEKPIAGAVFELTKENDPSFATQTAVSGSSGIPGDVSFTDLSSGTYILTEAAAPEGYEITFGDGKHSMFIPLSYTESPEKVQEDTYDPLHADKLMYKGAAGGIWKITNRNIDPGTVLPSTGGTGTSIYMICGLLLISAPLVYGLTLKRKLERRPRE